MVDWQHILDIVSTLALFGLLAAAWGFALVWLLRFIKD